ncbi:hypothetical protein ES706_04888 [subsurface metagenome]
MDSGIKTVIPEQIRDALLSLPNNERRFIITDPETGEHKVIALRRNEAGNIEYDFESIPE